MKNLIQPDGVTEKDLDTYLAGLQKSARKDVRNLLGSGAGEAEIAEYIASLEPAPEDEIGPPEGQPPFRTERSSIHLPSRQEAPSTPKGQPIAANQGKAQSGTPPDRILRRRHGKPAEESHKGPPGVQGANTGYWQAGGVTRAGAKRSKRP